MLFHCLLIICAALLLTQSQATSPTQTEVPKTKSEQPFSFYKLTVLSISHSGKLTWLPRLTVKRWQHQPYLDQCESQGGWLTLSWGSGSRGPIPDSSEGQAHGEYLPFLLGSGPVSTGGHRDALDPVRSLFHPNGNEHLAPS